MSPASDITSPTTNHVRTVGSSGSSASAAAVSSTSVSGLNTYRIAWWPWCTATQSMAADTRVRPSRTAAAAVMRARSGPAPRPRRAALDEAAERHQQARPVHGQDPDETVAPAVQRHEPALVGGAVHHPHLVGPGRAAGELDLAVVLVGPEPGHRVVGRGRRGIVGRIARQVGQEPAGRVLTHGDGVVPVLDPHQLAEAVAGPAGHVAGRHDARGGEGGGVAHDPVVERQPRPLEPPGVGR